MIDALLHSVTNAILNGGYGYDTHSCAIMPNGQPAPECGDVFIAVHQGPARQDMHNAKNDYFGFFVTVTMRVSDVPVDRIGDTRLAAELASQRGFNRRCEELANFLHMDWGVLQDANSYMVANNPRAVIIHGFCEPAVYRGMSEPQLVGGEWFWAVPEALDVGLKAQLRFDEARRLQTIAEYV